MITEGIALILIAVIFGCLWYLVRGLNGDINPIWGNVIASGISAVLSALFAIWLINGNVMVIAIVPNATYDVPYPDISPPFVSNISANQSTEIYKIGEGGTGMHIVSAMSSDSALQPYLNQTTATYYHFDTLYLQIQDIFLAGFFVMLTIVSSALFAWHFLKAMKSRDEEIAANEFSGIGGEE